MLRSLVLIVVCPIFASGAVSILEKMPTQSITPNSLREANDLKEPTPFYEALAKALKKRKTKLEMICPQTDPVARRILEEYGAIYLADKKVTPPPVCVFTQEEQVTRFQEAAGVASELIGFDEIELQPEALRKLKKAREEAQKEGLEIGRASCRERV